MIKPTEAPEVAGPEQQVSTSDVSDKQLEDFVSDPAPEIPDLSHDRTDVNPTPTKSSNPLKPPEEHGEYVMITGTSFQELGCPTVLAKHSAKDEFIEKRKLKFDIVDYSQLTVNEVFLGYLNQVIPVATLRLIW